MGTLDLALHTFNFVAPAMWTALLLVFAGRLLFRQALSRKPWWRQWAVISCAGLGALLISLWLTGHDGRMVGYGAMVLACSAALWVLARRTGA